MPFPLRRTLPSAILVLLVAACHTSATSSGDAGAIDADTDASSCGNALFGVPAPATGLSNAQCRPSCGCGGETWKAPVWDEAKIGALATWTLLDAPAALSTDPYLGDAPPVIPEDAVCAVAVDDTKAKTYRLKNFPSASEAEAAGAIVTHYGVCGLCSSLADLAVYARVTDLTAPVRNCGIANSALDADIGCIEKLGFTHACAQIWAYNTSHTRAECSSVCFSTLGAKYHEPDGKLNACLLCDEQFSGPVFKAIAGRTRRNTGIASALCRPCSEVKRIAHAYP